MASLRSVVLRCCCVVVVLRGAMAGPRRVLRTLAYPTFIYLEAAAYVMGLAPSPSFSPLASPYLPPFLHPSPESLIVPCLSPSLLPFRVVCKLK